MSKIAELDARLEELHQQTRDTPLFNPVFQLGLELSRRIERGELDFAQLEAMVAELECEGLTARADRLARLVAPLDPAGNLDRIGALAAQDAPSKARKTVAASGFNVFMWKLQV